MSAAQPPPSPSSWPRNLFEKKASEIARGTAAMLLHPSLWIDRRKETFTFMDDTRVRRQISVDFTAPENSLFFVEMGPGGKSLFVPVGLLAKRPLKDFDLFDEDQRPLPALTKRQNGLIAEQTLVLLAELALEAAYGQPTDLDPYVWADLRAITNDPEPQAAERLENLSNARGHGSTEQREKIWASAPLRTLARDLAFGFVLLAHTEIEPGERRLIKFSYEEELPEPLELGWKQRFGLQPVEVWLPTPSLGFGDSYHAEMLAADDLLIEEATLYELGADGIAPVVDEAAVDRMHLVTSGRDRDSVGFLSLSLRLMPYGLLPAALLISWLTTLLLAGGLTLKILGKGASVEASSALLVALPAIFAVFLSRPGEHRLVQRFVSGLRTLVLVSSAASLTAAVALAAQIGTTGRIVAWSVSLAATAATATLTTLAYARARRLNKLRGSSDT